jgi:hypothetical protein
MNTNKEKNIDEFLDDEFEKDQEPKKKVVIQQKDGLIERIDKKYVTEDGKMLLRERYY